jgi:hypothetical protein
MTETPSPKFTEEDIAELARDIGKPLPRELKQSVMARVHARSLELAKDLKEKRKRGK